MTLMNHTPLAKSSPLARPLAFTAAGALLAMAGLTGCSRSDDAQAAVEQANISFGSVAAGDSTAVQTDALSKYKSTEELVKKYAGSGDGYAEAAAVSLGLARLGQASLASQDAAKAETQALHKARIIRGMIHEWITMTALSKAASTFDPSDNINELNGIIKMRQQDIEQYRRQSEQINSEIADKEAKIADLRQKASAERSKAGELELQMPRVSAVEAAEIAQRVREHTLRGDQFDLEATRIEGVVGQLRPGAREIELNVEKASSQIDLLNEAIEELRQREASSRQDSQMAHDNATAAAQRIKVAVNEYTQLRQNEVKSANERAISMARSALTALRDANNHIKETASLTKASIQQSLGDFYARQAGGYAEEALTYKALEQAGLTGDWDQLIKAALAAHDEAKQNANQAFKDAAAALRRAGGRGDEAEKIEATAQRLERLGGVVPEPEIDSTETEDIATPDENDD